MKLEIKELVIVDYINESDEVDNTTDDFVKEEIYSHRYTVYESSKDTFVEAIRDYEENCKLDNIVTCHDMFDGSCLEVVDIVSARVLGDNEIWSAWDIGLFDYNEEVKR